MDLQSRIQQHFYESIETIQLSQELMVPQLAQAAERLMQCLMVDGKIIACGNGSSASAAQRFVSHMLNRFDKERPGLAAYSLSADSATMSAVARDHDFDLVFSKQLRALGQPQDVLLAIDPGGNAANIIEAISTAHERQMAVIALTGGDGGQVANLLTADDTLLCVPADSYARIEEMHILALHCLCDSVDCMLLGVD